MPCNLKLSSGAPMNYQAIKSEFGWIVYNPFKRAIADEGTIEPT